MARPAKRTNMVGLLPVVSLSSRRSSLSIRGAMSLLSLSNLVASCLPRPARSLGRLSGRLSGRLLARLVAGVLVAACTLPALASAQEAAPAPAPAVDPTVAVDAEGRPIRGAMTQEQAEASEAELQRSIRVFQQRYLIKDKRLEVLVGGNMTFGDAWVQHYAADASLLFHINERLAIGGTATKWWGQETEAFGNVEDNFGLFPEKSALQAGGHLEVQWSPVIGKFASFGVAVMQLDGYLLGGGGAARTTRGEDIKPYGVIGAGLRLHTLRWLTVSVELRDLIMSEGFQDGSRILQHWSGGIRLGFWIPPTFQYRYER